MLKDLKQIITALVRNNVTDKGTLYKRCLEFSASWPDKPDPKEFDRIIDESLSAEKVGIEKLREWVSQETGEFGLTQAYEAMFIDDCPPNAKAFLKATVRAHLHRLLEQGVIAKVGKQRGHYRKVDNDCPAIDLAQVRPQDMELYLPLGLGDWVKLYRKSIVVVAGVGQRGKTSLALDFAKNNMLKYETHYFFSEGGVEELRGRLECHEDLAPEEWTFVAHERAENFQDVIVPDAINIIDYLAVNNEFWTVSTAIDEIFKRLNNGMAWINIQKGSTAELGRGGDFSMERSRLYITLNTDYSRMSPGEDLQYGQAKIVKAKGWKKNANPDGRVLPYSIRNGWDIRWSSEWAFPESHQAAKKGRLY